jgi:hypothetical protein
MLTLKKCRDILGPSCSLSDSELEQYRDCLYALADIASKTYPKSRSTRATALPSPPKVVTFETMLNLLSEAEREEAKERVSIMEVEGEISREEAEKMILSKYLKPNKRN